MARRAGGKRSKPSGAPRGRSSKSFSLGLWIFLIIALMVLIIAGGALVVTHLLGDRFAQRSADQALESNHSTRTLLQQQRFRQLQLISRIFATDRLLTSLLVEAAESRDPAAILDSLAEYQNLLGFDLAVVLDKEGVTITRTDNPESSGDDLSADPLMVAALKEKQAFGIWAQGENLYHAAALPLVRNFDQVGYIIVALSVNDALARQIQRISDADTVILVNSSTGPAAAASTLAPTSAAELISSLRLQGDVLGRVTQRGETASKVEISIQDQNRIAFLAPLRDAADQPIGAAVAITSFEQRLRDFRQLQLILIGLGAASLIMALLLSQTLARRSTGPIAQLANAAEQASQGDYSAPLPDGGSGDAGRLRAALDRLLTGLSGRQALELQVARVHRYLPEPARGGSMERAQTQPCALLAIEMRRFAKPKIGYDPEEALGRMTRDLQRISAVAGSQKGRLESVFGHRALVLFDGESASFRAFTAATEILHLLSERENVFDEPEPPVVALASGPVVLGSVVWSDQPSTGVVGLPIQQLESLLREAAPGEIYFSKDFYTQLAPRLQQAGVKARGQRGLLSPQPLVVLSGEHAAQVTGYQPPAQATAFPEDRKSLSDVRPGAVLGQRFEILAKLGTGRMGQIFKAQDRDLGDLVVLKMLKPEVVADAARFEHLKRLAQQARLLRHPNVLSVLDFAEADGLPYLALEYARGLTLRYLLGRGGRLTPAAGVYLARQIGSGLHMAHQEGLLHLGIKPENVLVEPQGHARLMDFGLSPPPGSSEVVTGACYLSPERLDGHPGDVGADIYALGTLLYEIFTAQAPYSGDSIAEIRQQHLMQDPAPPSTIAEDLPPALDQIILRAMSKAADARHGSVAELLDELAALS